MRNPTQALETITTLGVDRLTAQTLRFSFDAVTVRDLFRVLWVKYHELPPHTSVVPRSLLDALRQFLPYRNRTLYQLRHFVRRTLRDERCDALREVIISPPIDKALGKAVQNALPGLREVLVIPSLVPEDPVLLSAYLGTVAARVFAPRFREGQCIGLGGGRAIFAFAKALPRYTQAKRLTLYALSRFHAPFVFIADAEKAIGEAIVECRWRSSNNSVVRNFEGIPNPNRAKRSELDWIFVGIGSLSENAWLDYSDEFLVDLDRTQKIGAVAEVLFHLLTPDGIVPLKQLLGQADFETVPLRTLQENVNSGRPVVAIAGGQGKAAAILAAYRACRLGGALFNCLVTDESCAIELLRLTSNNTFRLADVPGRAEWWEEKHRFLAAHLRYGVIPPCKSKMQIANRLKVPRKKVQRWLKEAEEGVGENPPIVSFFVRVPSPELALEVALVRRYRLLDARIVPSFTDEMEQIVQVGFAAAQLFCDLLQGRTQATISLGSGYEIRAMVECLDLPRTLRHFPHLQKLEFWGLAESPILTLVQGIGVQPIINSIALRCGSTPSKVRVRCYHYRPQLSLSSSDGAFLTIRAPYQGDLPFLESAGLRYASVEGEPVGYLLNQFFDAQGQPLIKGETKSVPIDALRELTHRGKPVVALNARTQDLDEHAIALRVACLTGLVNCLVVPRPLAERMLQ